MTANVEAASIPDCDVCEALEGTQTRLGLYNSPTRRDDEATGGRWANLCAEHFEEHGIDTSVTERRVHYMHPNEVHAVARVWGGRGSEVIEASDGVWRFRSPDGELYEVHRPGTPWPAYEDDGRPCGDVVSDGWHVRALRAAPDDHFEVGAGGVYRGDRGDLKVF
jgi:hypothetical protein